jgi:AraC-like DNA-binding protein
VGHHTVPAGWQDAIFTVHHFCVYWGMEGTGGVTLRGKRLTLGPRQILILMEGTEQEIYALDESWEYCWWTMDGPSAKTIVREFGLVEGIHDAGKAPINYIRALESTIQGPGRRNEIHAGAIAFQLLCAAAQATQSSGETASETKLTEAATNIILASWDDPEFSIERLANQLEVHRSTLSRRFRKVTGTTLATYITSVRMQNAITMLRETPLSIAEIACRCGYADPNYFSKVIRVRLGKPPTAFRRPRVT